MINVFLNQQAFTLSRNSTLHEALHLAAALPNYPETDNIAAVVNNNIIPKSQWQQHICQPDDKIELFTAVTGG